jgi:hypothetical protein
MSPVARTYRPLNGTLTDTGCWLEAVCAVCDADIENPAQGIAGGWSPLSVVT